MIIVDSSVWIDYFRGVETPQTKKLDQLLGVVPLAIGDLILAEVLQGCSSDREFREDCLRPSTNRSLAYRSFHEAEFRSGLSLRETQGSASRRRRLWGAFLCLLSLAKQRK